MPEIDYSLEIDDSYMPEIDYMPELDYKFFPPHVHGDVLTQESDPRGIPAEVGPKPVASITAAATSL